MIDVIQTEVRKQFIEGVGWVVSETPVNRPLAAGQQVVNMPPPEPATPVRVESIPLELAETVCRYHGLYAVPLECLTDETKAALTTPNDGHGPVPDIPEVPEVPPKRLTAAEKITAIKGCASIEELDELMDGEERSTVIAAAEEKMTELAEAAAHGEKTK